MSRPWLPSWSKIDNRPPQRFGAAIESPGQIATTVGLSVVNSPGPSPRRPHVAACEPSG